MSSLTNYIRASSADIQLNVLLQKPTSELLGVSEEAAQALKKVGIQTIFDLGTSNLFATAQAVIELTRIGTAGSAAATVGGDLLSDGALTNWQDTIANLSVDKLRVLTLQNAQELSKALDVCTIRDLALWPPYRAACSLVGEVVGSTQGPDELQAEVLRPRLGEYPTERVYYSTLVMLQMEGQGQQIPLDRPVSLDPAVLNSGGFNKPAVGALLTFSQSWYAQGITLGHMLHSLALAPGEATRIAVIDWSRRTSELAAEAVTESEQLDNATLHSRALSEVQRATARDFQAGGSRSSGSSFSMSYSDASARSSGLTESVFGDSMSNSTTTQSAITAAEAQSSSWSQGNRSVLGTLVQNVNDSTEQHSTSVRNRRASAVREVSQSEHEAVSTRIVANYNHMHALTVQYYEVVQIYRTVSQLHQADRVLFVPMQLLDFNPGKPEQGMKVVERFRAPLVRAALNRRIRSIIIDDTTAVTIRPVATVKVAATRPELLTMLGTFRPISFARPPVPPSGGETATSTPPAATPPPAPSSQPLTMVMPSKLINFWDISTIAMVSRVIGRPIIRSDSDALHIPDDTELSAISFDNIKVGKVRLDRVGPDTALNQPFTVTDGIVDIPLGVRFIELEALHLSKAENASGSGTMTLHCSYLGRRFNLPPIPIELKEGTAEQKVVTFESDRADRQRELLSHLQDNREYYSRAVFRSLDSAALTMVLSQYQWNGKPLIDQVEPIPLTVAGNYLVLRAPVSGDEDSGVLDASGKKTWKALLEMRGLNYEEKNERLIPIPTSGVFAEAVLGRSNSAEKLDITRFWNWQDSPMPLQPTEIAPVSTGTRATTEDLKPGQLSSPVLNILNPTNLPDPSGLNAILNALSNLNFRDMSGLPGSQEMVKSGMAGTLKAATEAGQLASENMRTEAQKAVAMGQIAADIVKSIASSGAAGGGGFSKNISAEGARINHGRDMDSRSVPGPGGTPTGGAGGATSARGSGSAGGSGSGAAAPSYSHEGAYTDQGAFGFSPDAINSTTTPYLTDAGSEEESLGILPVAGSLPPAINYCVPAGSITDPYYRDNEECKERTGHKSGRKNGCHPGIDVSWTNAKGKGAEDPRRGLPVYAMIKSTLDISILKNARAHKKDGDGNIVRVNLGLNGEGGIATLQNAKVIIPTWPEMKTNSDQYGAVLGLACRYNAGSGLFTVYVQFMHLITDNYLPKDGKGKIISAEEWNATGKGIGFGPLMQKNTILTADQLTGGSPLLVGYLGATQFPHVHISASYAPGEKGYLIFPQFDPTIVLVEKWSAPDTSIA